jgi:uncharacterized protein (DUF58 family)
MQVSAKIYAQIRHVELYTRRLLKGVLIGNNRSGTRGLGFEFDQLREYQIGDDVRSIDWRSSARMQSILVKQYLEERNRTVIVGVDVSMSMMYGIDEKYQSVAWIASIVALIAAYGSDRVGLILYSDVVEKYIPPRSGLCHARCLMRTLFSYVPTKRVTNVTSAFKQLRALKERSFVCMVSDFIEDDLNEAMAGFGQRHELIALRYLDPCERLLPSAGFLTMADQETDQCGIVDLSLHASRRICSTLTARIEGQNRIFKKYGVSFLDIVNQKRFIQELGALLRSRMRY